MSTGLDSATTDFVAFDLETTGLSAAIDRIVEIGAVRFDREGNELGRFQSLVNPQQPIPLRVQAIHGITDAEVADAPHIETVLIDFLEWIGAPETTLLIAHNARFDAGFLGAELARLGRAMPGHHVVDTLPLARQRWPEMPTHRLSALASFLGLDGSGAHRALADSLRVRGLWLAIREQVELTSNVHYAIADPAHSAMLPLGWDTLSEASRRGRSIRMEYLGGSRGPAPRLITPIRVEHRGGIAYVIAYCHLDHLEKSFRLDRIQRFDVVDCVEV